MAGAQDERRIVTILFADVVGSTTLSEKLDLEEVRLIIREALDRASQAIEAYGGTINKLMGDGLLALFGAPVTHEDDPERAIRAALDIISMSVAYAQEVRLGWGIEGFAMRVGIHTGGVIVGELRAGSYTEYGVTGDTVNTAARLQAAAENSGLLVSEATQRQVASLFEWGEARGLNLKGKTAPVTAFPVKGVRQIAGPDRSKAPMVGRDSELGTALELLHSLASGHGAVLFIIGEPGIGKTRLADELRQHAVQDSRYQWLEGRCVSYGETLPYWPYRDLLRNWLGVSATEPGIRVRVKLRRKIEAVLPGEVAQTYPYLAAVLGLNLEPEAAAHLKPLSPESLQFRTFEVIMELLRSIARDRPVVVSLEDLHWADATSLALTERLLSVAENGGLMLAVSQRPETDHPCWTLKEKAAREYRHLFRELPLQPLRREAESELLGSLAEGRTMPPNLAAQLLNYAEGNPFYLEQLIRSLIDSGTLIAHNSHWELKRGETLQIPPSLEAVIIARIDRLEPVWRETLTSASVLGRAFGLEPLGAVTGIELPEIRLAVHHLLRLDFLREEAGGDRPVYRFKHALIQETAYRTLVRQKRVALHRHAAEWYEDYYKDRLERVYGLIAHHWLETDDHEKAARYLKLAGDRALSEWALDEAAGHFRSLAPLLDQAGRTSEAAEVLFQLASTLHLGMRYREANEVWQWALDKWVPPPRPPKDMGAALRIADWLVPWEQDPIRSFHTSNELLHQQLYDTLLEGRPGPYVVPGLARRWQVSDDGLRYRIELDPNATWNDGKPLLAADVVESFRATLDPSGRAPLASVLAVLENAEAYAAGQLADFGLVGIKAPDDRTLELRLRGPAPYWIFLLLNPRQSGARRGRTSGPFHIVEFKSDRVRIELDRNYSRERSGNIATVEWVRASRTDALQRLLRGELDVAIHYGSPDAGEAVSKQQLVRTLGSLAATAFISFRRLSPNPLDVHMRRALAFATDRSVFASELGANEIAATGGLVPPGLPGHTADAALPFRPDLARQCRSQSEHRGPVHVLVGGSRERSALWDPIFEKWIEVLEIAVEREVLPAGVREEEDPAFGHAVVLQWIADYPDPLNLLYMVLHSKSSSNRVGWTSPEFDALIDQALEQQASSPRLALFHEADRLAVQRECSVIPLYYLCDVALHQPWVHGWWMSAAPSLRFDDLTIDHDSPRAKGLDTYVPDELPR